MVNEAIFHGLIAALSRGESLQNAMLTFYYAGYGKQEIEDAARELHKQTGGQAEKMINPKKILEKDKGVSQAGEKKQVKPEVKQAQKIIPQTFAKPGSIKKKPLTKREIRKQARILKKQTKKEQQLKPVQIVSKYGEKDEAAEELKKRIEQALSNLKNIKLPSEVKVIHEQGAQKRPVIVQRISGYGAPPKPISRAVILVLIFILILLLGTLAAVFIFKEQLIEIFNKFNIN